MSDSLLDKAAPPRKGEELPLGPLAAYLAGELEGFEGPLEVLQFPKGHSNLTYLLRSASHQLVLRRPPFGNKVKTAHDMGREVRILTPLSKAYPLAPAPLCHCVDESVIGAEFYVMSRIEGIILRKDLPKGLTMSPDETASLHTALIDGLAELHQLDVKQIGLGDLGRPQGYVRRQVDGWTRRYRNAKTDEIAEFEEVAKWLDETMPSDGEGVLIHNDYKLDNVVLATEDPTKIVGVLDWEMATVGDPLMDLGTSLAYWLEESDPPEAHLMRWAPTTEAGSLTRAQLVARYGEKTGRDVSNIVYYYVFGLFKIAGVLQQIYARYKKGLTKDPRFAPLIHGVRLLLKLASVAIAKGSL